MGRVCLGTLTHSGAKERVHRLRGHWRFGSPDPQPLKSPFGHSRPSRIQVSKLDHAPYLRGPGSLVPSSSDRRAPFLSPPKSQALHWNLPMSFLPGGPQLPPSAGHCTPCLRDHTLRYTFMSLQSSRAPFRMSSVCVRVACLEARNSALRTPPFCFCQSSCSSTVKPAARGVG